MKKRIKSRWLCLLLAVIMTVGLLAGCGSPASSGTQENSATLVSVTDQTQETEAEGDISREDTDPGALEGTEAETADDSAAGEESRQLIDEDGVYTTKDDVALYIHTYGKLPSNFITKKEAEKLGWSGGSLEPYAPGKCIGGNHFGNYEGILPDGKYKECDIDTLGKKKRGAKRLIYSDDGRIYYTEDHYETFEQLY